MDTSELTVGTFIVRRIKKKNPIMNPSCRLKLMPHKKSTRGDFQFCIIAARPRNCRGPHPMAGFALPGDPKWI